MTEPGTPGATGFGLTDLLGLFGTSNPFAGVGRSAAQVQLTIEQVNTTMAQLSQLTNRIDRLLDDIEPALRAVLGGPLIAALLGNVGGSAPVAAPEAEPAPVAQDPEPASSTPEQPAPAKRQPTKRAGAKAAPAKRTRRSASAS